MNTQKTSFRKARLALVGLCALSIFTQTSYAASYYVSPQGADSSARSGSSTAPWKTIQYALDRVPGGNTILIRPGTYPEDVKIRKSGTSSSNTTLQAADMTNKPLITGTSNASTPTVYVIGQLKSGVDYPGDYNDINYVSYVKIKGIKISNISTLTASKAQYAHHVIWEDNEIFNNGGNGISSEWADYLTIRRNNVYGNCKRTSAKTSGLSLRWLHPVDTDRTGFHNIVEENRVYENFDPLHADGNGISVDSSGYTIDGDRPEFDEYNTTDWDPTVLIRNNLFYDNGGRGILVLRSENVTITNNTCVNNCRDTRLGARGEIVVSGPYPYWVRGDVVVENIEVLSNITSSLGGSSYPCTAVYMGGESVGVASPPTGFPNIFFNNNLRFGSGNGITAVYEPNPISDNPDFLFPDRLSGANANFQIAMTSPAYNASISTPAFDFRHEARSDGSPDVGAYERGAASETFAAPSDSWF